jgi:16S rRNA (cytosine967-C5)-methyltransferase
MTAGPPVAEARQPPGYPARHVAAELLEGVLRRNRPLDEQFNGRSGSGLDALSERDRALAHRIAATVLRRLGTLRHVIGALLDRGLPGDLPRIESALLIGAAQLLFLDIPDHAAVDLAVRLVQSRRGHARYAGLVNAVLRRIARNGNDLLAGVDPLIDTPEWLMARWSKVYGADTARAIAYANRCEPPLDLTVKGDPDRWAEQLRGRKLPTGSVRLGAHGQISALPGYAEGAWWVQDAAAALPVRLFGDLRGRSVVDLCAAPGGKTAQLALAGADVTAVDRSEARTARLKENLARTGLAARIVVSPGETWDAVTWAAETLGNEALRDEIEGNGGFDGILVDAPCTSTGTIRRHPDIAWRKALADIELLSGLQKRLLVRAVQLTKPGGMVVFCTCSLEPEEGEDVIAAVLDQGSRARRRPISEGELPGLEGLVTPLGDLRTLPCHWPDPDPRMSGLDGFFAARLERI